MSLGFSLIIVIIAFVRKTSTLIIKTFLADLIMSYAILILILLKAVDSFSSATTKYKFMIPGMELLALALTTAACYLFLICSIMIVLKSTVKKGIAVGALISISRLTRIVLNTSFE